MIPSFPNLDVFKQWAGSHPQNVQLLHAVGIGHHIYHIEPISPLRREARPNRRGQVEDGFFHGCEKLFRPADVAMEQLPPAHVAPQLSRILTDTLTAHQRSLPPLGKITVEGGGKIGPRGSSMAQPLPPGARARRHVTFAPERTVRTYDPRTTKLAVDVAVRVQQREAVVKALSTTRQPSPQQMAELTQARRQLGQAQRDKHQAEVRLWQDFSAHTARKEPLPRTPQARSGPQQTAQKPKPPSRPAIPPPSIGSKRIQAQQAIALLRVATQKLVEDSSREYLAIPSTASGFDYFRPELSCVPIARYDSKTKGWDWQKGRYDASRVHFSGKEAAILSKRPNISSRSSQKLFWTMLHQQGTDTVLDIQSHETSASRYYPTTVGESLRYGELSITCKSVNRLGGIKLQIHDAQTNRTSSLELFSSTGWSTIHDNTAEQVAAISSRLQKSSRQHIAMVSASGMADVGLACAAAIIEGKIHREEIHWHNKEREINRIVLGLKAQRHPYLVNTVSERLLLSKLADRWLTAKDRAAKAPAPTQPVRQSRK